VGVAKIVTVAQMREIEMAADRDGWSYAQMMSRAGQAVAGEVLRRLPEPRDATVLILVGAGNNGGDGLVAGCRLREAGCAVVAFLLQERRSPDEHADRLVQLGGEIVVRGADSALQDLERRAGDADVIVDAVLGTGFHLPLRKEVGEALRRVRGALAGRSPPPLRVAVDCPSGLDCDTGAHAPEALPADATVTLAAAKPGLLRPPGSGLVGEIVIGEIGLRPDMPELSEVQMELADSKTVRQWLPARPDDAHKGTFGKVVIAAGSVNYPGSAGLAGQGAYRVGAGLVCLAVPGGMQSALVPILPEATWIVLPHEMGVIAEAAAEVLRKESAGANALLIGPGLGREEVTRRFLQRLLAPAETVTRGHIGFLHSAEEAAEVSPLPQLVIDADGLRLVSEVEGWSGRLPRGSILTPHPGEMAALTGLDVETIQGNREGIARERASEWGQVVVLKGARTVVAAPDGRCWVVPFATAALAKAGTGDVLAGAVAGLCAQGIAAPEAAVLGAYLHGRAGMLAAERAGTTAGVLAGEVARLLPEAMAELAREPDR
jgi:NAD(P)H-hydrate epimerase